MRYVALVLTTILGAALQGGLFGAFTILGVQLDLLLAMVVVMVIIEKSLTPVFYMVAAGLILDILFARALGFYALQYLVSGLITYSFLLRRDKTLPYIAGVGGMMFIIKDLLALIFNLIIDNKDPFFRTLATKTLPGALLAAGWTVLIYLLFRKLYDYRFMWPIKSASVSGLDDD